MLGFSFSFLNRGVGASRSAGICGRPYRAGSVPGTVCERGLRTAMPCGNAAGGADGASGGCGWRCRAGRVPGTGLRAPWQVLCATNCIARAPGRMGLCSSAQPVGSAHRQQREPKQPGEGAPRLQKAFRTETARGGDPSTSRG